MTRCGPGARTHKFARAHDLRIRFAAKADKSPHGIEMMRRAVYGQFLGLAPTRLGPHRRAQRRSRAHSRSKATCATTVLRSTLRRTIVTVPCCNYCSAWYCLRPPDSHRGLGHVLRDRLRSLDTAWYGRVRHPDGCLSGRITCASVLGGRPWRRVCDREISPFSARNAAGA
jgi:hypothetical protein